MPSHRHLRGLLVVEEIIWKIIRTDEDNSFSVQKYRDVRRLTVRCTRVPTSHRLNTQRWSHRVHGAGRCPRPCGDAGAECTALPAV